MLALGSLAIFLGLSALLHLSAFDRIAEAPSAPSAEWFLAVRGLSAIPRFAALALASVAMAATGRPVVAVALPFLFSVFPLALGAAATPIAGSSEWPSPWIGAFAEALLACAPAVGVTIARRTDRGASRPLRWYAVLGVAIAAIPAALLFLTVRIVDGLLPVETMAAAATLFVFGITLGRRSGWWPWAHVGVAVLLGFPFETARYDPMGLVTGWLPLLALPLWSAQHDRLAYAVARLAESPLRLLVLLNGLNVADALLTQIAIDRGRAFEANPVVAAIGMSAKIALVAGASILLYRMRPRALLVPCVLLGGILAYHIAGWTW